ncbi:MAG: phosphoribosylanthranilate isomerase [Thermoanaerobaculum sp.]|nr:phosphoribosylanthranilate isomerase [Thermoanaerobaculum sp.]
MTMVTVKICGLTDGGDAMLAAEAGADFLGFVFAPGSPRSLALSDCAWIRALPCAGKVGVFRNQAPSFVEEVREAGRLELVQLHGQEPPELCHALGGRERVIKAVTVDQQVDWGMVAAYAEVARILFDRGGGGGQPFPWRLLACPPFPLAFWVAGGLKPGNVGGAIATCHPAGVDVSSGVESAPGRKDPVKVRAFIRAVRQGGLRETATG